MQDRYLTPKEVVAMLKISKTTLHFLCKSGNFPPGIKIGHARRWSLTELQNFLKSANRMEDNN